MREHVLSGIQGATRAANVCKRGSSGQSCLARSVTEESYETNAGGGPPTSDTEDTGSVDNVRTKLRTASTKGYRQTMPLASDTIPAAKPTRKPRKQQGKPPISNGRATAASGDLLAKHQEARKGR